MGKYSDTNLIRYEEAIQLHFDSSGKTAWLTLKNYGVVFGVQPFDVVKQVTLGVSFDNIQLNPDEASLEFIALMGFGEAQGNSNFRPHRLGPISISKMLGANSVIRFQVEVLEASERTKKPRKPHIQRGYERMQLNGLIEDVFLALNPAFSGEIDFIEDQARFWQKTNNNLVKLLRQPPGALDIDEEIMAYNSERTGLTAYFPQASLILEEQRTGLNKDRPGKTYRQDMRLINPMPFPSDIPIPPMFINDGFERFQSNPDPNPKPNPNLDPNPDGDANTAPYPYRYDDFIALLDEDYQKQSKLGWPNYSEVELTFLSSAKAPKAAGYLHKHIQRICCYSFRGDTRDPASVKAATGLMPGFTRKDEGVAKFKDIADEIDAARKKGRDEYIAAIKKHRILHLGVYTYIEDFKGYLSTTTSTAIAKCFANLYATKADVSTYCYAVRCHGGFNLPTSLPTKQADFDKKTDTLHRFVHFAEQEVAVPGAIYWDNDVVGVRKIQCNVLGQFFSGPIFLKDSLKREDPVAFSKLFELLSGKSQGEGFGIERSYDPLHPPFEVRSSAKPASCDLRPATSMVALSPAKLKFGRQMVGTKGAFQQLTITNTGTLPVSIRFSKIFGKQSKEFVLVDDDKWRNTILKAGEICIIKIQFAPTGIGECLALFKSGGQTVALSGMGIKASNLAGD